MSLSIFWLNLCFAFVVGTYHHTAVCQLMLNDPENTAYYLLFDKTELFECSEPLNPVSSSSTNTSKYDKWVLGRKGGFMLIYLEIKFYSSY